jgi:hypothetical protein
MKLKGKLCTEKYMEISTRRVRGYDVTLSIEIVNKSKIAYNVVAIGDNWAKINDTFNDLDSAIFYYNNWENKNES